MQLSIHGAPFPEDTDAAAVRGCLRVVKPGGWVAIVSTTPGWRMDHQRGPAPAAPADDFLERQLAPLGFAARDAHVEIDYGSPAEALATWGCIYGEDAIDYLLDREASRLSWSLRIWYRRV